MAYDDNERSTRSGAPRELYRFEGTYVTYRYTSDTKAHTWQAPDEDEPHTYFPITLQRSEVTAGTPEDDNLDLSIDLPVSVPIVTAYAFNTSPPDLFVTVWRFHTLNAVVPYWRGGITNINIEDGIATFTSPSEIARAMAQEFPNVFYQAPCNHVLYDARCKVDYDDWSGEVTVMAVADKAITVDELPAKLNGQLIGGEFVLPSGERRMIVSQAGIVLGLNFPFSQVNVGTVATIAAGCDYAYTGDCKLKFANQLNFGGFPFIPEDNIFNSGADPGSTLPDNTCLPARFEGWTWRIAYKIGRTGPGSQPYDLYHGGIPMSGLWEAEVRDPTNSYWSFLGRDNGNNKVPQPGAGPFDWQVQFLSGTGNGTTCHELWDNDGYCTGHVYIQHWTMQAAVEVAIGQHYSVFPMNWHFSLPAL